MSLSVVILAAGQGKRMYSDLPKVLHKVGAKSTLQHVLDTVQALQADQCIVVYGHGGEQVLSASYTRDGLEWVEQTEQLGTGHAVAQAAPLLRQDGIVLILYGDVPLLRADTLNPILASARQGALGVLTAQLDKPDGYGRIVRDAAQQVLRIVEDKDASPAEKAIGEINTGILALSADRLCEWIGQLNNDNAQGEYYLTDIIEMAVAANVRVDAHIAPDPMEIQGINNRRQLAEVERYYQRRQAAELLLQGVTLRDPDRIDIRGTLKVGRDVCIDINAVFEGEVTLGDGVSIEPNCIIRNSRIGPGCLIHANSVIEDAELAARVEVGPFARLRPGTRLAAQAKIGNFVETKNALIGEGSKVNHLSYIGDTDVGTAVNIGAGTITCNYDGANKHKTIIEDNVFVGSNTALVAPVNIGKGATIGAGSTISKNVPAQALALTRSPAKNIPDWRRPSKKKP